MDRWTENSILVAEWLCATHGPNGVAHKGPVYESMVRPTARVLGISPQTLQSWVTGARTARVKKIAALVGVGVEALQTAEEDELLRALKAALDKRNQA